MQSLRLWKVDRRRLWRERFAFVSGWGMKKQAVSGFAARGRGTRPSAAAGEIAPLQLDITIEGFAAGLRAVGYAETGVRRRVHAIRHFSRWLERRKVAWACLQSADIACFLDRHLPHCACTAPAPKDRVHCRSAIRRFVQYLRDQRLIAPPLEELPRSPVDELLETYDAHLREVCGLAPGTRENRRRAARRFLHWRFGERRPQLRHVRPKDIRGYVLERARHLARTGLHPLCVDLRSFLRFLDFTQLRPGLAGAVPQLPQRAKPSLPTMLEPCVAGGPIVGESAG